MEKNIIRRDHGRVKCKSCKERVNKRNPCDLECKNPTYLPTPKSVLSEHDKCNNCVSSLQRSSEFVFWESLCGVHKIDYLFFWKKLTASERKEFRFMKVPPEAEAELDLGPIPTLTRGIANGKNPVEE